MTTDDLIVEISARYPYLKDWMRANDGLGFYTLIIIHPQWVHICHRIVHDHEFRERARPLIPATRTNIGGDNAVLVLAPVQ